ncbi:unnamed protein product [Rhizoctonia solani]|uniref:Isopenicillin N synthase-like Fe(2+) 2OG dioxygenase domain-containing protein n=1 Tax=Rhizoctonia solani TaxID=456999 RepID=A0A8H3DXU7_9AGAM|nr:unnamed protein product [Rhizoctonia solani]
MPINNAAADMHVLHYPSRSEVPENRESGIGAHTDFQCFTILWQGEIPALQVKNASGQWVDAQPMPASQTNFQDGQVTLLRFPSSSTLLSAYIPDDIFKSTVHRVIIHSGVRRYSIPLFFGTDDNVNVEVSPFVQITTDLRVMSLFLLAIT